MRFIIALLALLAGVGIADAANRFAVCTTTCTWDASDTSMWSTSSGGATGASVPGAADAVILDAATCVGGTTCTITVNAVHNILSLTMGACTASTSGCILDFAANDNNITSGSVIITGTGTRTLNMGDGIWTITGVGTVWDAGTTTNLTFNRNSSTMTFTGTSNQRTLAFGGLTYGIVNIGAVSSGFQTAIFSTGTFSQLNLTAPLAISFPTSATTTIQNAFTWAGSAFNTPFMLESSSTGSVATISVASGNPSINWGTLRGLTFSGGATFTATNSISMGGLTGITVTGPSGGNTGVQPGVR